MDYSADADKNTNATQVYHSFNILSTTPLVTIIIVADNACFMVQLLQAMYSCSIYGQSGGADYD